MKRQKEERKLEVGEMKYKQSGGRFRSKATYNNTRIRAEGGKWELEKKGERGTEDRERKKGVGK